MAVHEPTLPIDEKELLGKCPWCDYSLRGLPIEHRCPECGCEFNRRWKVFRCGSDTMLRHKTSFVWINEIAWYIGIVIFTQFVLKWILDRFSWIVDLLFYGSLLYPLYLSIHYRWFTFPAFCAVGPLGLTIGHRESRSSSFHAWTAIRNVQPSGSSLTLELDSEEVNLSAASGREADRLADYIEEMLEYGYPPPPD